MKTFVLFTLVISSALIGGGVAAQEGTEDFKSRQLSSRTRAEVVAELHAARAAGLLEHRGESYHGFDLTPFKSTRTRAEVLAELDAARRAKQLDTRNSSATYGGFGSGEFKSTRSRAEVRAELTQAQKERIGLSRGDRSGG